MAYGKASEIRTALSFWKGSDHHTVKYFDEMVDEVAQLRAALTRLGGCPHCYAKLDDEEPHGGCAAECPTRTG